MLWQRAMGRLVRWLGVSFERFRSELATTGLPRFANAPQGLRIEPPRTIVNPLRIYVGDHVYLGPGSLLIAVTSYPGPSIRPPGFAGPVQRFEPTIRIGHRVTATAGLQVAAHDTVTIEDDVLFATNVNVTDGFHGYATADEPYKYQPIWKIAPIRIGRGCWIGQNVVIHPGVTVGELSIVGANSVVTTSLPARCIAVGAPARVIKRWDDARGAWCRVEADERRETCGRW